MKNNEESRKEVMGINMIEVKHLRKEYEVATPLADVNVTINKGDIIAIIGPSGTGKSTLIRCINQLETPTSGQVYFQDQLVNGPHTKIDKIRAEIGMVFQQFNLFAHKTVRQNITLAPVLLKKMTREEADDKATELLNRIGLADKADVYPSTLSGGQQQRVAIARALAMEPKVMLFDEPT